MLGDPSPWRASSVFLSLQSGLRFKHIVGLYSELLGVDHCGRVYEWAWQSPFPLLCKEEELGLVGEHVRLIAGRVLRATAVTESGKVGTYSSLAQSQGLDHKFPTVN